MVGETLAHYRILERLGKGGMGEVYLAEDTRLDRRVALKVLPPEMASDPDRRSRFEREAKAVAALNHPNIVTVHSVEEANGIHFITMELVEGKTLTEVIGGRGMSLSRIFDIAIPMAEAVSAAHEQGITHRDLKPDNVMVTTDGRVKILDFGLAKLVESSQGEESAVEGRTATRSVTEAGKILGTVAYMSPEQAEGKGVDHRSDLFSLGVILYQMACGEQPFKGDTKLSVLTSILRDTPSSVTEVNRSLPRHLGRIVKRCLAKEPERRYQTALDLRNELASLKEEVDSGEATPVSAADVARPAGGGRGLGLGAGIVGAAVVIVGAVLAVWLLGRGEPATEPAALPPSGSFTQLTDRPGEEVFPTLAPDGKTVAYAARDARGWDIFLQRVGGQKAINLTEDSPSDDMQPAFSPDGESLAFWSKRGGEGIYVMGATGESVRRLTDFGYNPAWSPDGTRIVFAAERIVHSPRGRSSTSPLWVVDVATGETTKVFDGDAVQPSWSPGGERIAFWGLVEGGGQRDIWTVPASGGDPVAVTADPALDWNPVWAPDGRHLYFVSDRGGSENIWRVPIDESSGRPTGNPQPVTSGVTARAFHVSLSADGRQLAYAALVEQGNVYSVDFDPLGGEPRGEPTPVTRGSTHHQTPSISPDGRQVAFTSRGSGSPEDIVVMNLDGSDRRQLTDDPAKDRFPRWTPDGSEIVFYSDRGGSYEIWAVRPDGTGLRALTDTPYDAIYPVLASDGSRMVHLGLETGTVLTAYPDAGEGEVLPVLDGKRHYMIAWSPDGARLAGHRALTGGIVVYSMDDGSLETLTETGVFPEFLQDGRRLLYIDDGDLWTVDRIDREPRMLISFQPDVARGPPAFTADRGTMVLSRHAIEADVWMLTLADGD